MNTRKLFVLGFLFLLTIITPLAYPSIRVLEMPKKDKTEQDFRSVGFILNAYGVNGSGVLVGPNRDYVITAKHVITKKLEIGAEIVEPDDLRFYLFGTTEVTVCDVEEIITEDKWDIAILKINNPSVHKEVKGVLVIPDEAFMLDNDIFYGVGFGLDSKNPEKRPTKYDESGPRNRMIFKNRVDRIFKNNGLFTYTLSDPSTFEASNGAIDGEGLVGPGDSGGGAFIEYKNEFLLSGIFVSLTVNQWNDGENIFVFEEGQTVNLSDPNVNEWLRSVLPADCFYVMTKISKS